MAVWRGLACLFALALGAHAAGGHQAAEEELPPSLSEGYRIAPGDVLRIAVWKEPELSTEVTVRLDGRVTVPLLGELVAQGRAPDELAAEIQLELQRFVEVPQVTLTVSQTVSARFYVLGEVAASGAYPLQSQISVLQALALAGGFREFAKRDSIKIIRRKDDGWIALSVDYKRLEAGEELDQNVFLEAGDTILVP